MLLEHFESRIAEPRKFAIRTRVLLLKTPENIDVDISLGGFPFEQSAVRRAKKVTLYKGIRLRLCTAEDLIVYKAFANRPIDWMDIEGIIAKQIKRKLDWRYIVSQLTPLVEAKEEPGIVAKLKVLRNEIR